MKTKQEENQNVNQKRKIRRYIFIAAAVIIVVFMIGIKIASANTKMPVNTCLAARRDVESEIQTSGSVESDIVKTYYSQIPASIGSIPVQKGQIVKKGDVLVLFQEQSLEEAKKSAQAAALSSNSAYKDEVNMNAKTQSRFTEATVNLEVLEQQITDYKAFIKEQELKLENKRNSKKASLAALGMELSKRQADGEDVSDEMAEYQYQMDTFEINQELVDIQHTIDDARETLTNLENYKTEMKSLKSATEDNVMSADTKEAKKISNEATQIKNQLIEDYAVSVADGLKAEFEGVVTEVAVREGAPVLEGGALVTVADSRNVHVTVNLSKTDLSRIKEGQKAEITIAGNVYEGNVDRVYHMAVPNANNIPVVSAQISITNADEQIYLGVEAKVNISAQHAENVLTVPVETVNADKQGEFVYIVENGVITRREVLTGISSDEYIEIISGLNEGDQVITEVTSYIVEGKEVSPVTEMSESE